ncbi:MAG: protein translocase subunit SecF [Nocardiopsaceae bacterium]|jgi:preprotein translocase subunit SecF|nr:protein translocase subunit SecF [Nocardiopsaceae bacterium]
MSRLGDIGGRLYRGEVSFDFVGRQKLWYRISGVILVVSIAALLIFRLQYSVDFKGGSVFSFKAPAASSTQISNTITNAGGGTNLTVQKVGGNSWKVQTEVLKQKDQFEVQNAIADKFLGGHAGQVSLQSVGPSWGSQISLKALEALIAFLIVIVLYLSLAFEWRMATAALIALLHDIVITVGVYALLRFQVSPATVIGLLTILGYSLYDTVVVFDKVRENTAGLLATRRVTYSESANLALNQTLVRSINTSVIALLPVAAILAVSIFLLGNGELKDLSLVLFVGMLTGTYSSIFIATPVLADLKEREPEFRQLRKQIAQRASSTKRQAKVAVASAPVVSSVSDEAPDDTASAEVPDDQAESDATPVAAARPTGGSGAPRPSSGPRQQPRRSSAAQRRPSGKKKRR